MSNSMPNHDYLKNNFNSSEKYDNQTQEQPFLENDKTENKTQAGTTDSLTTIFAVTNTMTGSVCLVIPGSFISCGLFLSIIIMIIIGLVSFLTCTYVIRHSLFSETDFKRTISRVLGVKWSNLFSISSCLLMFCVGVVYFLLINNSVYPAIDFICLKCHTTIASIDKVTWDQFSLQYLAIIMIVALMPFFFIKEIAVIVKLARFGIVALIAYMIFIFYIFFDNITSGRAKQNWGQMKYFTSDISTVIGNFALAYMCHNAINQIMSANRNKQNNIRDLSFGYMNVLILYGIIGIFGSIGLIGRTGGELHPTTIMQYFAPDAVPPFLIEILFMIQLSTIFPIFVFISKAQFFSLFYNENQVIPPLYLNLFNAIFAVLCLGVQIPNVNPNIVIGIAGAVIGFLIVYLFPIQLHLVSIKKYQRDKPEENQYSIENEAKASNNNPNMKIQQSESQIDQEDNYGQQKPNASVKLPELILLFTILLFGIGLAVIQLLQIFGVM